MTDKTILKLNLRYANDDDLGEDNCLRCKNRGVVQNLTGRIFKISEILNNDKASMAEINRCYLCETRLRTLLKTAANNYDEEIRYCKDCKNFIERDEGSYCLTFCRPIDEQIPVSITKLKNKMVKGCPYYHTD